MLNFLSICSGDPIFVLLFEEKAVRYVYTILVSPRTCYYNCVTPRATGATALKPKITSREYKIEFLRHTVLYFQALQAKVPERPSVRPSGRLDVSPLLILWMHALCFFFFFFFFFAFFIRKSFTREHKIEFPSLMV